MTRTKGNVIVEDIKIGDIHYEYEYGIKIKALLDFIHCYRALIFIMKYINPKKIIAADILEPYQNSNESWDMQNTRGWQVAFLIGYRDGHPDCIIVDKDTKEDCINLMDRFGLNAL